jgi:hypothetical protein
VFELTVGYLKVGFQKFSLKSRNEMLGKWVSFDFLYRFILDGKIGGD